MPEDEKSNKIVERPGPKEKRLKESYEGERPPGRKPPRPQPEPVDDQGSSQGQGQETGQD